MKVCEEILQRFPIEGVFLDLDKRANLSIRADGATVKVD